MKVLTLVALLMSQIALAETYRCTRTNAMDVTPYDTFLVSNENGLGSIKLIRHAFFGSEEFPALQDVQGCVARPTVIEDRTELYIECDADGDAGYITINKNKRPMTAKLVFPEGNMGYAEDTELDLICLKYFN